MDVARFRFLSPVSAGSVAVRLRVAALAGVRMPAPLSFAEALEVPRVVAEGGRDALEPGLGRGTEDMSVDENWTMHHSLELTTAIPEDVYVECRSVMFGSRVQPGLGYRRGECWTVLCCAGHQWSAINVPRWRHASRRDL